MRINLYAQNKHAMVIDGITIAGFAEGDWLQVKLDGNSVQRKVAADGALMNFTGRQGGTITVSLMPTSPALGKLLVLRNRQDSLVSGRNKSSKLFGISLVTGVNEDITAAGCAFGELPEFSTGGTTMQARKFVFECLSINLDGSDMKPLSSGFLGGLI